MAQYKCICNLTNGSATVTGINTKFLTEVSVGDLFKKVGESAWYEVGSITDDTTLTLTSAYAGATASGVSCIFVRDFTPNYSIPELSLGDLDLWDVFTRAMRKADEKIDTGLRAQGNIEIKSTGELISSDIRPRADDTYNLGSNAYRWKNVRAVTVTTGDLAFIEDSCYRCGVAFQIGDAIALIVEDLLEQGIQTRPIHLKCAF